MSQRQAHSGQYNNPTSAVSRRSSHRVQRYINPTNNPTAQVSRGPGPSDDAQHYTNPNPTRRVWPRRLRSYNHSMRPKQVDFVSRLPFELVSSLILPSTLILPLRQAFAYLHVCRTWRLRVLQSVQLHYFGGARVTFGGKQIMMAYSPYITHVALGNPSELPLYFFSCSQFSRLQSLNITLASGNDMRALIRLVQPIAVSLKEIKLTLSSGIPNAAIAFKDIVPSCPLLEVFTCSKIDMAGFPSQNHVEKYPNVKKLIFGSITHPLEEKNIIGLLERFPSLQLLSLPHCQSSTPLRLISQCCPYLDSLWYSQINMAMEATPCPRTDTTIGLHSVYINAGANFHIGDIASLLASHGDTLISIGFVGKFNHQDGISSSILRQDVHFKRLTHLLLYPNDDDTDARNALLQWILKGAPYAREIETVGCNVDNHAVYDTMKKMANLESLSFALPSTALVSGLEYHATTLRHRSQLRIVSIDVNYRGDPCPRVWRAVAGLSNLRELFMQLRGATLDHEFVIFIEAMAHGCPE